MAGRRFKARDKRTRRRVRGALVEENVYTKEPRRIGRRETECEVKKHSYEEEYGDKLRQSPGAIGIGKAERARRRLKHGDEEAQDLPPSVSARQGRRKGARQNNKEGRLFDSSDESAFPAADEAPENPPETEAPRIVRPSAFRKKLHRRRTVGVDSQAPVWKNSDAAHAPDAPQNEGHPARFDRAPNTKKKRLRHQAEAFREAEAAETAARENVEGLSAKEADRSERIETARKKRRLDHSDEGIDMVRGAGSLGAEAIHAAAMPAGRHLRHEVHNAGRENAAVESAEAGVLTANRMRKSVRSHSLRGRDGQTALNRLFARREESAAQTEHRKKERIKAFYKKRRQRAAIAARRRETLVTAGGFADSANTAFSVPAKARAAAKSFFSEHKGAIVAVAIAALLFSLFALALSGGASIVQGSGTTVVSTTYVSTDEAIYAVENAYCALEDALNAQLYRLSAAHPGYDDYEYQIDDIGHNPYHLISYLQVKFGGFTDGGEVQAELERLIRQQYRLSISDSTETRTRMEDRIGTMEVADPVTGEIRVEEYAYQEEVEYEHRTSYAVLTNRDFDIVARENLSDEELALYNALNTTYGNRSYLFGTTASYGGGSAGIHYEIPPEALSDVKFANMIREAEKYLGMAYVWGGKSPRTGFDCSGFVCWVINHCGNGWSVGSKRAKDLCRMCVYVSPEEARPGDLIFFEKTYDTDGASHVGIYVGNNTMIHCGNPIKYGRIDTRYFKAHFLCFGRLPFYDE